MTRRTGKTDPSRYRDFVESALADSLPNPFEGVYGGMMLGSASFIKNALKRAAEDIPKNETARRKVLASSVSGINEIVSFLSLHFKEPENVIVSTFPYRSYALYLRAEAHPGRQRRHRQIFQRLLLCRDEDGNETETKDGERRDPEKKDERD